ncbi:hypothetical protein FGO68_gene8137 [Halteria grandinella]|uniref:A-kinase anchor protein 7-like phosphoesterase domain-containing protein n=1 Tax=Halteria grandinella TaxID=5974 RepID=A0A8J8NTD6_HALGN|nr:hypothetical protein FGO68_gene8137 [Halteria grandinella]
MLHLTILMLDLSNQEKLTKAQALLTSLLPKIQNQFMKTPMNLTFKGVQTFQDKNPSEARVLYFEVKQDEGHGRLKSMASYIIDQFVTEGIIRQDELSQVKFNPSLGYYDMKFHLSLINSKRWETFNAKPAIDKFKDTSLGTFRVNQIHISSRSHIDEEDGSRVERNESRGQGYYACDGKIELVE